MMRYGFFVWMCGVGVLVLLSPLPLVAQTIGGATTGGGAGLTTASSLTSGAVKIISASSGAGSATSIPSNTNYLGPTYVNPFSLGLPANYNAKFGPQNPITGPTGKFTYLYVAPPSAATTTATTATTGTGFSTYGVPRNPVYSTFLSDELPIPKHEARQLQTDVRATVERSSVVKNKSAIEIRVDGAVVLLNGQVGTEKERRLVEGLARMTPGVLDVHNALTITESKK